MTFVERFESMYLLADPVDYDPRLAARAGR